MAAAIGRGFVEVIGLFGTILGIVQFGLDNFPQEETASSVIRIAVGLDNPSPGGLSNAGGDLPDIRLFNEFGEFLGINSDGSEIQDGNTKEIKVTHNDDNGQQATYTLFSANDNAICIAYATITWPDGQNWGWTGDWGQRCNGAWFFSNLTFKGASDEPKCMWIDANGDQPHTGFQLHWPDFAPTIPPEQRLPEDARGTDMTENDLCFSGPPFQLKTEPDPRSIVFNQKRRRGRRDITTLGYSTAEPRSFSYSTLNNQNNGIVTNKSANQTSTGSTSGKKQNKQPWYTQQLVIDYGTKTSVRTLCESETSRGPDFANYAERLFCRMSDKTIWPFCTRRKTTMCFSPELQRLLTSDKTPREEIKRYAHVATWNTQ